MAKKNNSIKIVFKKLQKGLSLGKKSSFFAPPGCEEMRDSSTEKNVPEDVKEGHVAVLAVDGEDDDEQPKRFIVPLNYLTHPTFMRLLEEAAEEYGFDHEGALTIPCRPSELERILADLLWLEEGHDDDDDDGDPRFIKVKWGSWNPMLQSC